MAHPATTGHFNAASHGVPEPVVYEAMAAYLQHEARVGPDMAALDWAEKAEACRDDLGALLGARPVDIAFSSTTTTAFHTLLAHMDLSGKRVLVTPHEWGDYSKMLASRPDIHLEVLPEIDLASPDLSAWAARIDEDVAAIFVPMVTSISGVKYPVQDIGALPRPVHTKFVIDAAQAVGQMPLDVTKIGCDALVSTGRKWLRGPRQSAFLWLGSGWQFQEVALSACHLEAADQNMAIRMGLGAAVAWVLTNGAGRVQAEIMDKSQSIRSWAEAKGMAVIPGGSGAVSIKLTLVQCENAARLMVEHGIVAKAPLPRSFEPLFSPWADCGNVLRLAPHVYTSDNDLARLFGFLAALDAST